MKRMQRGVNPLIDLARTLLLVLVLPVLLLLAGPLLVIAAIRGRASLGQFRLRPSKYEPTGRIWALLMGLLVWLLVWGGIGWLWVSGLLPVPELALNTLLKREAAPLAAATSVPLTPSPTVTVGNTATLPPTATSATPVDVTPPTPTSPPTDSTGGTAIFTPSTVLRPTQAAVQQGDFVHRLDEANRSLIQYLQDPQSVGEETLADFWADDALVEARLFAADIALKYQPPLSITYQTLDSATVTPLSPITTTVASREVWTYTAPNRTRSSLGDYVYTFAAREQGWVIVSYEFTILPSPDPLTTTLAITSTEAITSSP